MEHSYLKKHMYETTVVDFLGARLFPSSCGFQLFVVVGRSSAASVESKEGRRLSIVRCTRKSRVTHALIIHNALMRAITSSSNKMYLVTMVIILSSRKKMVKILSLKPCTSTVQDALEK